MGMQSIVDLCMEAFAECDEVLSGLEQELADGEPVGPLIRYADAFLVSARVLAEDAERSLHNMDAGNISEPEAREIIDLSAIACRALRRKARELTRHRRGFGAK